MRGTGAKRRAKDFYYTFLLFATIPMYFLFSYVNWVSMKFFRHN